MKEKISEHITQEAKKHLDIDVAHYVRDEERVRKEISTMRREVWALVETNQYISFPCIVSAHIYNTIENKIYFLDEIKETNIKGQPFIVDTFAIETYLLEIKDTAIARAAASIQFPWRGSFIEYETLKKQFSSQELQKINPTLKKGRRIPLKQQGLEQFVKNTLNGKKIIEHLYEGSFTPQWEKNAYKPQVVFEVGEIYINPK